MIVIISAEPNTEGIRDFEENEVIRHADTTISISTWSRLREWFVSYDRFTPMTKNELSPYLEVIDKLDSEGMAITRQIANEWFPDELEKFYYYSMGREFTYVIYRDGTEKRLD